MCIHTYIYIYTLYAWMYAWMYVCVYVCMDGWMDGWMDGCMDGWMYVRTYVYMYLSMYYPHISMSTSFSHGDPCHWRPAWHISGLQCFVQRSSLAGIFTGEVNFGPDLSAPALHGEGCATWRWSGDRISEYPMEYRWKYCHSIPYIII